MTLTFEIHCSWADCCASQDGTVEADSYDELFEEMEEFFGEACGFTAVETFRISSPYAEEGGEGELREYEWDWDNLKRNKTLADVWDKVKREIKEEFGKEYFNEIQSVLPLG